ncbi:hypothetical protein T310_7427 [Rasamsonia emersonii CBS 393.64]|uniref:Uncharacterized protein n=1 Tax=Rasamsonia emersonii (strain ATCC 16479 / CBS 393.64 / IMI 116815) TaxID=1408163 RepID=A0A0F4YLB1_RASE3|nr:hypothetical protein T310_7427 [Rasamsonia emersonii CBS 393.64]KKA18626.1 hypothetical protein T310_7427 [Rasamsonia emersonii CBS 393.64]
MPWKPRHCAELGGKAWKRDERGSVQCTCACTVYTPKIEKDLWGSSPVIPYNDINARFNLDKKLTNKHIYISQLASWLAARDEDLSVQKITALTRTFPR